MRQVLIERTPSRIDAISAYRRRPVGDFTSRRVPVGFWRVIVVWIQECVFHALVRALANDLGETGITVNAVAPTIVKTEGLIARTPTQGPSVDEIMKFIVAQQTIKRPSTPVDAANALSFLVSEDAGFITGQILHVDGGFSRSGA
jgi:enoyl-[acyl-carrier-protein] reductase (NADH)